MELLFATLALLTVVTLLALSSLFSGLETAAISVSDSSLSQKATGGDRRAKRALKLLRDRRRLLGVLLVGNNLVNVALALFMERLLEHQLPAAWVGWSAAANFVVVTPLLLIFGEIVPKHYFHVHNERAMLRWSAFLRATATFLAPAERFCAKVGGALARPFGVRLDQGTRHQRYSIEDIRAMVGAGELHGDIETEERAMIDRIIDLQFTVAREIMTPLVALTAVRLADLDIEKLKSLARETGYSRFPVFTNRIFHLEGYLDIYEVLTKAKPRDDLADFVKKAYVVPETVRADALLQELLRRHEPAAIVIDEHGGSVGWVSLEDVLEEIVGEIEDEFDAPNEQAEIEMLEDGSMIVSASLDLDDLERRAGEELPTEEDFDTVGGLLYTRLGRVPEPGDGIQEGRLRFKVLQMEGRRISTVRVSRAPQELLADEDGGARHDAIEPGVNDTLDEG